MRSPDRFICALLAALCLSLLFAWPGRAATTFEVNSLLNTGDASPDGVCDDGAGNCTLREAIQEANGNADTSTITFDATVFASAQTITVTNGLPTITTSINIVGTGESMLTLSGTGGATRLFSINSGATLSLQDMTVSGSSTNNGGAIFNSGMLTVSHVTFSGNTALNTTAGGAIYNSGTTTVNNSTFTGNTAGGSGGAIHSQSGSAIVRSSTFTNNTSNATNAATGGGAIYMNSGTTLTVIDSSFVGNTVPNGGYGGGIMMANSPAVITNSTFSGNTATAGGGINTTNPGAIVTVTNSTLSGNGAAAGLGGGIRRGGGTMTLRNSIVANSTSGGDCVTTGAAPGFANSLVEDGSCSIPNGSNGNKTGDPALGVLTDGYFPLMSGSPARDAGSNNFLSEATTGIDYNGDGDTDDTLATDQAGANRISNITVDMGAAEFIFRDFVVDRTDDTLVADCTTAANDCTLRGAITLANALGGTDTITFDATVFTAPGPHTIQLTSALPDLSTDINVNGPGARVLSVRGEDTVENYRVFTITVGVTVNLSGLTLTNGRAADGTTGLNINGDHGGGIRNDGTLTLTGVAVRGNRAGRGGGNATLGGSGGNGGGIYNVGTLTISNSTISANVSGPEGNATAIPFTSGPTGLGGGIYNVGTLTVGNSTISGNLTPGGNGGGFGGGIYNGNGMLTVSNSTITANISNGSGGGGIRITGGVVTLRNTIVAGNSATASPDILGTVQSDGYNLIQNTTGATIAQNPGAGPDITGQDALLLPITNNGGQTDTHAPSLSSSAFDNGKNFPPPSASPSPTPVPTDQRGQTRPVDLPEFANAPGGDGSDIGAFERQTFAPPVSSSQLIISEFRLRGPDPDGAQNEFIEIYNNTDSAHTVESVSGTGYSVAASDGVVRCIIPNNTVIPARGHFLCVNSFAYSLASYPAGGGTTANGDATYTTDIPDNVGIALFNTSVAADFMLANRLDAVGSTSEANTLYKEGTGYPALVPSSIDYSFQRDLCGKGGSTIVLGPCPQVGLPKDTDNNVADFIFVDTNGTCAIGVFPCTGPAGRRLGAPGPENLSSPVQRNTQFPGPNLDSTLSSSSPPNRVRDFTSDPANNSTFGTLDIRKRIVNNTGAPITRLRFRIMDFSTFPVPSGFADLRVRTSTLMVISGINDPATCLASNGVATTPCTVNVQGTTLETPPSQLNGGGFNSTLSAGTVTLGTPLANGASINLRFLLGIQQTGTFKFFINVEALTGVVVPASPETSEPPARPSNKLRKLLPKARPPAEPPA